MSTFLLDSRLRVIVPSFPRILVINQFSVVSLRKLIGILEGTLSLLMHHLASRVILCLQSLILVDINELLSLTALFHVFAVSWVLKAQMQQITTCETFSGGQVILIK